MATQVYAADLREREEEKTELQRYHLYYNRSCTSQHVAARHCSELLAGLDMRCPLAVVHKISRNARFGSWGVLFHGSAKCLVKIRTKMKHLLVGADRERYAAYVSIQPS